MTNWYKNRAANESTAKSSKKWTALKQKCHNMIAAMASRRASAMRMWASANKDRVHAAAGNKKIGNFSHYAKELFKDLPQDEQDFWEAKAEGAGEDDEVARLLGELVDEMCA